MTCSAPLNMKEALQGKSAVRFKRHVHREASQPPASHWPLLVEARPGMTSVPAPGSSPADGSPGTRSEPLPRWALPGTATGHASTAVRWRVNAPRRWVEAVNDNWGNCDQALLVDWGNC
eukprot:Skav213595  [mRNA]  locus=scaffold77:117119:118072:+ [translate_table: standard]